jgi:hypothetical protein
MYQSQETSGELKKNNSYITMPVRQSNCSLNRLAGLLFTLVWLLPVPSESATLRGVCGGEAVSAKQVMGVRAGDGRMSNLSDGDWGRPRGGGGKSCNIAPTAGIGGKGYEGGGGTTSLLISGNALPES